MQIFFIDPENGTNQNVCVCVGGGGGTDAIYIKLASFPEKQMLDFSTF